jgi:hypothetical protein
LTPEEAASKQATRLKSATEDIRRGIDRVTSSPTAKAASKQAKMLTNMTAAVNNGTWAKRLNAVSLEDWKSKARDIGVNRIAAGIDGAHSKQVEFYSKLLPAVDAARAKVAAMPDVSLEDNINRMTTYVREMNRFKK